jgi:hypothetical protein
MPSRLTLNRETLRRLEHRDLLTVPGGAAQPRSLGCAVLTAATICDNGTCTTQPSVTLCDNGTCGTQTITTSITNNTRIEERD